MPLRAKRICKARSCNATHGNTNGYCDTHQDQVSNWSRWQQGKGNTTQRGYGHRWAKLRKQALLQDNYLCRECRRDGRLTEAKHVDHIKPKSQGGTDALGNLQALCEACHNRKTATEQRGGAGQISTG